MYGVSRGQDRKHHTTCGPGQCENASILDRSEPWGKDE